MPLNLWQIVYLLLSCALNPCKACQLLLLYSYSVQHKSKNEWRHKYDRDVFFFHLKHSATNARIIHRAYCKARCSVQHGARDCWWYVCNDVGRLMNHLEICPINLQCESVSSQAVCHSFILALLGMVIGSQSTSNGWIGPQMVWLRASAVIARVHSFVHGCARSPFLHATVCTQRHVYVTPSPLSLSLSASLFPSLSFEFGVLSIIASTAALLFLARRAERYSCEQVFLTLPSNYYQDSWM